MVIGIIVFHGNAALSLSVVNTVNLLCESEHCVHVFQNRRWQWMQPNTTEFHQSVHLHLFDTRTGSYEYSRENLLDLVKLAHFVRLQVPIYDVLIGVDQDGVIAAMIVKLLGKAKKFVYLSLELTIKADYARKGGYFLLKHWLERLALRLVNRLWIQDPFRGHALVTNLGQPLFPFTILPHAPRKRVERVKKPSYLRTKYGIPASSTILVYTGSLNPEFFSVEVGEMTMSPVWPQDAILVMHGFGVEIFVKYLKAIQNPHLIVSDECLSFHDLEDLVASADIGLALFDPTVDTNYRLMASGKVMSYLQAGIPVIATKTVTLEAIIEKYRTGLCIDTVTAIPEAYQHILRNYPAYAAAAARVFDEQYEFASNFSRAWKQVLAP